jgi:uncharacterized protein (DUF1501 family)
MKNKPTHPVSLRSLKSSSIISWQSQTEFNNLKSTLSKDGDSGMDASSTYAKVMEDGADTAEKESLSQLAARQQKVHQQSGKCTDQN